ncbi:S26 family signal peptidase [Natronomonas marina]|uniref:S26 family signal peptidase n=1 Tax=Natronomonas marina TaxID=2961939 RepID=UPI0020C9E871|nr:S26 family signal peptidase [Natronomonas marina]
MSDAGDGPDDGRPSGIVGWLKWFWTTDEGVALYVRDVVTSVGAVLVVGLLLFAVSGIWPPMVAIESGSMNPNMERGDLVFVVSDERFVPEAAPTHDGASTGVIPADRAEEVGHKEFGKHGDVIVYRPDGNNRRTPVIHRAMLWVEDGENWYDRADPDDIANADNCQELRHCPAPHAGFITKGDNGVTNPNYDQVSTLSAPVRPEWVVGTAELRVPYLGQIRLLFSQLSPAPAVESADVPTTDARSGVERPLAVGTAAAAPSSSAPATATPPSPSAPAATPQAGSVPAA